MKIQIRYVQKRPGLLLPGLFDYACVVDNSGVTLLLFNHNFLDVLHSVFNSLYNVYS